MSIPTKQQVIEATPKLLNELASEFILGLDIHPSAEQLADWENALSTYEHAWNIYGSELAGPPSCPSGPDKVVNCTTNVEIAMNLLDILKEYKDWRIDIQLGNDYELYADVYCWGADGSLLLNEELREVPQFFAVVITRIALLIWVSFCRTTYDCNNS